MRQSILNAGDLVKYMGMNADLGRLGFASNGLYEVKARPDGALYMQSSIGMQVDLVDKQGELTEFTDSVSKHACPLVLPRGI